MLIGRNKEKKRLLGVIEEDDSMFVAVYGRRRVGKTYLVRETFNNNFTFYHTGLAKSPMNRQLTAWRLSLREYGMKNAAMPKTWLDAFDMLKELIRNSELPKKLIFIDEMPWMDTQRSGFISALEHFWNGWASARKDVVLIICGSATSWIINKVIKNHGGLHNRVNTRIHLQPFTLNECRQYAEYKKLGMNQRQIMECYMIMGGIPFYWSKLDRKMSLAQNIDNLFFNRDGELYDEFNELYASLFRNPEHYIKIVNTLGTKRVGMRRDELINYSGLSDNGKLSNMLEDLEACGFIRKYNNFDMKSKGVIYQLIDSYTLFYYRFIMENRKEDEHFWSNQSGTPTYYNWCGLAFERLCLMHLNQLKKALGISGIMSTACAWRFISNESNQKGAQIDLLIDRNDNVIDICEMKFTDGAYEMTADEYNKIQNRRVRFISETKTKKAVHLVLVSPNGVKRNSYSDDFQTIITANHLFEE